MPRLNLLIRSGSVIYAQSMGEIGDSCHETASELVLKETNQESSADRALQPSRLKFGEFEPFDLWISDDFDEPIPEWEEAVDRSAAEL